MHRVLFDAEVMTTSRVVSGSVLAFFISLLSSIELALWSMVIVGVLNILVGLIVASKTGEGFSRSKMMEGIVTIFICMIMVFFARLADEFAALDGSFSFCGWMCFVIVTLTLLNILKNASKVSSIFKIFSFLVAKKASKILDIEIDMNKFDGRSNEQTADNSRDKG